MYTPAQPCYAVSCRSHCRQRHRPRATDPLPDRHWRARCSPHSQESECICAEAYFIWTEVLLASVGGRWRAQRVPSTRHMLQLAFSPLFLFRVKRKNRSDRGKEAEQVPTPCQLSVGAPWIQVQPKPKAYASAASRHAHHNMNRAFVDIMMATMMAKMPNAEAKISITKILTKSSPFWASASAHPLPQMPTHTPQARFPMPQQMPDQKIEYPDHCCITCSAVGLVYGGSGFSILVCRMIEMITP